MPMLATVKRLHFSDDVPNHLSSYILQLTHFSCCYRLPASSSQTQPQHPALPILHRILSLPHLRLVVIHVYKKEGVRGKEEMEGMMQDISAVSDPRVVVASASVQTTRKWGRTGKYRWDLAEEAVRKNIKYIDSEAF